MNLIRFTFANIFDLKQVMNEIKQHENDYIIENLQSYNLDALQITYSYIVYTNPYTNFINSICTPVRIEDLRE